MVFSALVTAALATLVVGAPPTPPKLEFTVPAPVGALSRTPDGRTFLAFVSGGHQERIDGSKGPRLVEFFPSNGTTTAYPNEEWNNVYQGNDAAHHFLGITTQRIGADGNVYVLDAGHQELGQIVNGGPKFIQIDIASSSVKNAWDLGGVTKPNSFFGDFRRNKDLLYITDAGAPAIIVIDTKTGKARRVLENTPSTTASFPVSAEGRILRSPDNTPVFINAINLEVSPDGNYLYFQPASGGLRRIATQWLTGTGESLESHVEPFALTVSSGGTAIDAEGNIYSSDTDWNRIIKISPAGVQTEIARGPGLLYANLWIDSSKKLFISASQANRAPLVNGGKNDVQAPFQVFSIDIGVGPSPIDHA